MDMTIKVLSFHSFIRQISIPSYLYKYLDKHVLRNFSRFRLRAHHLRVESCKWHGSSSICDKCECGEVQDAKHVLFFYKCAEVCELRMRYRPFLKECLRLCVCLLLQALNLFLLNLSSRYHWFWYQCIPESRLIQTPQVCVRFSFNFRAGWFCFTSQLPSARDSGCWPSL